MFVALKRDWFAPDGSLREVKDNPHEVSKDWQEKLPTTAKVVEGPAAAEDDTPKAKALAEKK
jgi:hypothetical protein